MMAARALLAAHASSIAACNGLLDDFGWQGFIEDSQHPSHVVRVVLEEIIRMEGPLTQLADLMHGGPGDPADHSQASEIERECLARIDVARTRLPGLADHGGDQLAASVDALEQMIRGAADVYRQLRPLRIDGCTLSDTVFGAH